MDELVLILLLEKNPKIPHKKCNMIIPKSITAVKVKQSISLKAFSVLGKCCTLPHYRDWTEGRYKPLSRQNNNKNTQIVLLTSQAT